ncbi:hypothetical protein BCV70DRAFT_55187 [Testicularia cyperi]|uniref:Uncharacterized protein n=1 Tax=Testicularia cyperi TaxID=1882483 RepID=A0A317XUR1_9BASI|nr:hypothetical protein BCV70DRAFT_55187 [Testicularia cyperi]
MPFQDATASILDGASASNVLQLLRSQTTPHALPFAITASLSSSDPTVQRQGLEQLQTFVHNLFYLPVEGRFFVSLFVTSGIIALLIPIGFVVCLHRIVHRRHMPFRLEHRAHGFYVVPNAINCFLLFEGAYGIATIAFNSIVWQAFHNESSTFVRQFQAWRNLSWIPLYLGAFFTGWGSLYTAPGALDKPSASRSKMSGKGILPWPTIVNFACLGTPLLLVISLIPPVVMASRQFYLAVGRFERWTEGLDMLLSSASSSSAALSQSAVDATVSQGLDLWQALSKSYYYSSIGYALWSFWALFFLFFYVPAGGTLVFLLLRQVRRQKAMLVSYQRKLEQHMEMQERQRQEDAQQRGLQLALSMGGTALERSRDHRFHNEISGTHVNSDRTKGSGNSGATHSEKASQELVGLEAALRDFEPESYQLRADPLSVQRTRIEVVGELSSTAVADDGLSPPTSPRSVPLFKRLMRMETSGSANNKSFTARKLRERETRRRSLGGNPGIRYKYLRRCLINLMILYFGISGAACMFVTSSMVLAIREYEGSLHSPEAIAHNVTVAGNIAAWASAVFGALTIGSIIFRNFDNPMPESKDDSDAAPARLRPLRKSSKDEEAGSPGPNDNAGVGLVAHADPFVKSRTLPAVPESVGMETSMMSVSRARPTNASRLAMKFSLSPQSGKGGALVLQPDDMLTSQISGNSPEMEETSFIATTSRGARARGLFVGAQRRNSPLAPLPLAVRDRDPVMSLPQDETESFGVLSMPLRIEPVTRTTVARDEKGREGQLQPQPNDVNTGTFDGTLVPDSHFCGTTMEASEPLSSLSGGPGQKTVWRKQGHQPSGTSDSSSMNDDPLPSASSMVDRYSRPEDSTEPETPASRIAREWTLSQDMSVPPRISVTRTPRSSVNGAASNPADGSLSALSSSPQTPPPSHAHRPSHASGSQVGSPRPANRLSPGTFF